MNANVMKKVLLLITGTLWLQSAAPAAGPADPTGPEDLDRHATLHRLTNAVCEAVIMSRPFVRLLRFNLHGRASHLLDLDYPCPDSLKEELGVPYHFVVGGRMWPAPEDRNATRMSILPGEAVRDGGVLRIRTETDPLTRFSTEYEFSLDPVEPRVRVSGALINRSDVARDVACWWPVAFPLGGRMHAPVTARLHRSATPLVHYVRWAYGRDLADPVARLGAERAELDLDADMGKGAYKVGFLAPEIVVEKPDTRYVLRHVDPPFDPENLYPEGGASAILFRYGKGGFCEAELLGPLRTLAPGERNTFVYSVTLEPVDRAEE